MAICYAALMSHGLLEQEIDLLEPEIIDFIIDYGIMGALDGENFPVRILYDKLMLAMNIKNTGGTSEDFLAKAEEMNKKYRETEKSPNDQIPKA